MKGLGKEIPVKPNKGGIQLPLDDRHYIEFTDLGVKDVIRAFQSSRILQ